MPHLDARRLWSLPPPPRYPVAAKVNRHSSIGRSGRVTLDLRARHHAFDDYLRGEPRFAAFRVAADLSQEFGAHIAVVTFSPTSKPKAYGAPTGDSVLSTYLLEIHSSPSPASSETAGEAAARVDGMKWEAKETAFLAEAERTSARKLNWWEVDMEALGADIVLVFVRALGMLRTNVQRHFDTIKSSRKEKMQP
ncbi:hypothetical protein SETIT_6G039400v2 [Setaria italica]|uniref:MADS-box domain-containing protein n=1 Tax=Setaria italica TaxID=4555 RepID=A0A368RI84_SETIT|nr:hypothetical protein SETIT_6G039400v2 [Setaria italica]